MSCVGSVCRYNDAWEHVDTTVDVISCHDDFCNRKDEITRQIKEKKGSEWELEGNWVNKESGRTHVRIKRVIKTSINVGPIYSHRQFLRRQNELERLGQQVLGSDWELEGNWWSYRGTSYARFKLD